MSNDTDFTPRTREGEMAREMMDRMIENFDSGNPNKALTNANAIVSLLEPEAREYAKSRRSTDG